MPLIARIVSGCQTGADRAALDFAIEHGIPHGGWCPAGRKSEDGPKAIQQYDIDAVRNLPRKLREAGFELYKL